jgi:hypothetical protein
MTVYSGRELRDSSSESRLPFNARTVNNGTPV